MKWNKLGLIFDINKHDIPWLKSHAMIPTPLLYDDKIRVFYSGRSHGGESKISYVDLDKDDPTKILYVHKEPLFDVGKIGMFDDSGTLATCAVMEGDKIYLFYTAYSISVKVPYRNSIGVAISSDGGDTFKRMYNGPIIDRSINEPYFVISPWVEKLNGIWNMWYASATDWISIGDRIESVYEIKHALSSDLINWNRKNITCIAPKNKEEANARPSIIQEKGTLKMWFTYRGSRDFRDGIDSYQIGYAEANNNNPTKWNRIEGKLETQLLSCDNDNKMKAYPSVLSLKDKKIMFYNGNGFGYNGFMCAEWK